jgi:predicted dehydrogenase
MNKKIALIGCGIWGKNILRELNHLGCETTVFESEPRRRQSVMNLGATEFLTGLPSNSDYFDGIIISTPSSTHLSVYERVVDCKCPVFMEKPLTINLEEARTIEKLPHDNLYIMHIWLYHPGIQMLAEIARSKELGRVLGVRSIRANWTSPRKDTDSAWNLSPHDLIITKAILGLIPEPIAAVAERHKGVIRGLTALLGNDPYSVFEVSNRYERKIREVRVHFEKGVAILKDEKANSVTVVHGDAESDPNNLKIEYRKFDSTPPLRLELLEFLEYLNGGPEPRSKFRDGLEVVQTIDRIVKLTES